MERIRQLIRVHRAQAAEQLGRVEEAEAILRKALEGDPEGREPAVGLACLLLRSGRAPEAQTLFERVLAADEKDAGAWSNLGLCRLRQGQTDRAEEAFQKALEFDENLTTAWLNLGHLYREAEKAEPAALALGKALDLDPRLVSAQLGLAVLFTRGGEILEAAQCGLFSLETLGLKKPDSLEDWQDLTGVFETLSAHLKEIGRQAEASLAETVWTELNAFTPPESEDSAGVSGTAIGASQTATNPAVICAPEERGGVPEEKTRIDAD